jgi:hypothetical protein
VVLTHGYWQRRFGGSDSVIGRTIQVDGTSREIVGVVAPERDDGLNAPATTIVYWPLLIKNFWNVPLRSAVAGLRSAL